MGVLEFFSPKRVAPRVVEACTCPICSEDEAIAMPLALPEAVSKGEVVIVAGPGVGMEGKVLPHTLYQTLADDMALDENVSLALPDLMSMYCRYENGRHRLLTRIQDRLDFAKGFLELRRQATAFHRQFAMIPSLSLAVTTNWDDFFEEESGAVPLTSPEDFEFWTVPRRVVVKLYGSIKSPGSVVATREDCTARYRQLDSSEVRDALKQMLAAKTIVYTGFPAMNSDFERLHQLMTHDRNGSDQTSYFVTLDADVGKSLSSKNMVAIAADSVAFLSCLKDHLVAAGSLLADEVISDVMDIEDDVNDTHFRFTENIHYGTHPTAILTGHYQDGLIHALEHIALNQHTGRCSDIAGVRRTIAAYTEMRADHLKRKRYEDIAYVDGYSTGLGLLLAGGDDRKSPPLFYVYGADHPLHDEQECRAMLKDARKLDEEAYDYCVKLVERFDLDGTGLVLHHAPYF